MTKEKNILEVRHHTLLSSIIISALLTICGVLYLALTPHAPHEEVLSASAMGGWVDQWQVAHPIWSHITIGIMMLTVAIKLAQLASRYNLYGTNSHLPMELFPILSIGVMVNAGTLKGAFVITLVAYSMMRYISSYRNINAVGVLLSGSFALGLSAMLYPPTIVLWGVVPFVLVIFERTMREVIVAMLSLLIVPFGYVYVRWLQGESFGEVAREVAQLISADSGFSIINSLNGVSMAMCGILIYLTLNAILVMSLLENTVKARRRLKIVALYALAIVAMLALPSGDSTIFSIVAIPLSILIPITLLKFGRTLSFMIYVLLFVACVVTICLG